MICKAEWQDTGHKSGTPAAANFVGAAAFGLAILLAVIFSDVRWFALAFAYAAVVLVVSTFNAYHANDAAATGCAAVVFAAIASKIAGGF